VTHTILDRLAALARTPVLLVASDYDGTLAPIVIDPAKAAPHPRAIAALARLATMPHTHGAIISGRARADLIRLTGAPPEVALTGSHGAEPDSGPPGAAPSDAAEIVARLAGALDQIAARHPGVRVERKPFSAALHVRGVDPEVAHSATEAVLAGPGALPGVAVRHGSKVVELCVSAAHKGEALARERFRYGATAVLFLGDDLTDEDAFKVLGLSDLGVRVDEPEPGAERTPSAASAEVPGVPEVADLLERLIDLRSAWLAGRGLDPIESLSILSDQRTACVVDRRGRVVWCCVPRLDSASIFGAMLGGPAAGTFEAVPEVVGAAAGDGLPLPEQRYAPDTFVLETRWPGLTVTDYLDASGGRAFQRAGRTDLIRVLSGEGGRGGSRARVRFAPRVDFGRVPTRLRATEHGLEVEGSPDPIVLRSEGVEWTIVPEGPHHTGEAIVDLSGGPVVLELRAGSGNLAPAVVAEEERRRQTVRFWAGWAGALRLPSLHNHAVRRSALVIKALCHGPTGAIAAAATTSLPEHLGGSRNWDYRFCWPRDASLAAAALVRLGNTGHALKFLDWLLAVVDACESPDRLRPIYTLTGRGLPPEAEISHLCGYGESRPVLVSNAAANQVQLDVFGPIVDLVAMLAERGAPVSPDHWRLVRAMVQAVEARWREPDHGIWEIRADRRHHVHSKAMCWLAVHRALQVQEVVLGRREPAWMRLAQEIRDDVLSHGWNERVRAFTAAYGSETLDAAALWVGLSGLISADDPRWVSTVEAVERGLRRGAAVYRYLEPDGLPGQEGGMVICAGWLAQALASVGRREEARALLDELVAQMGPTGTMAEQFCPRHRIALGNIPQAYSHLAVINAVLALGGS